ncbi:MAG TPA: phosphatase PAP2 family protein [Puia sp.]
MVNGTPLNRRNVLLATAFSALYLILASVLIGFKTEQLILVGFFNVLFYLSGLTRRWILGFSVFIVFWALFDFMKAFPNYRYNTVHIGDLYGLERRLFGIHTEGVVLTPNEYWKEHSATGPDIFAGLAYLCWMPLPIGFAWYLFSANKERFFRFTLSFLTVNLIGFVGYYALPAAPPWYIQLHGMAFNPHTPGNVAGLGRFDAYFHVSVFSGLYAKSSNVFAAMPSLHAAYPLTVLFYGIKYRLGWVNAIFAVIMVGIWFAAVYSSHHYVLDVLAGIFCGVTGCLLFNYLYEREGGVRRVVSRWVVGITKG